MRHRFYNLLMIIVFSQFLGCSYLEDRGKDFLDCFKLSGSAGIGGNASAQVGPLGFCFGYFDGYEAGILSFEGVRCWKNETKGLIFKFYDINETIEDDPENLYSSWSWFLSLTEFGDGEKGIMVPASSYKFVNYFWLEVSVRFFIGVRIGFNIGEFVDFLLGWAGIDLAGDDSEESRRKRKVKTKFVIE